MGGPACGQDRWRLDGLRCSQLGFGDFSDKFDLGGDRRRCATCLLCPFGALDLTLVVVERHMMHPGVRRPDSKLDRHAGRSASGVLAEGTQSATIDLAASGAICSHQCAAACPPLIELQISAIAVLSCRDRRLILQKLDIIFVFFGRQLEFISSIGCIIVAFEKVS